MMNIPLKQTTTLKAADIINSPSAIQRLVIVTETFAPEINGVANTLRFLVEELNKRGIVVFIIRPKQNNVESSEQDQLLVKGLPIPYYSSLKFGLPSRKRIDKVLRTFKPDALYIATEGPLGYSALKAAKKRSICVVSGFHTNFHLFFNYYRLSWLKPVAMCYLKYFHNATRATFTPTEEMKSSLYRMGIQNAVVMSRGIDTKLFTPEKRCRKLRSSWGLRDEDLCVIYVGRIAVEKNLQLAIKSYQKIRAKKPSAKFVLVGNGPLKRQVEEKHPDFILTGELRDEDLARHYASGDLFLFPSMSDTFGNVVTEAMASGLSVLSFNYAAPGALISDGLNGHLVPFGNELEYESKAEKLAVEPNQICNSRLAARKKSEKLSWTAVTNQLLADLSNLIKEDQHEHDTKSLS